MSRLFRESGSHIAGAIQAFAASIASLVRSFPMFVCSRPRSPLRVLCITAFDTITWLRDRRWLTPSERTRLAALLDLGACVNDFHDGDPFSRSEYYKLRRLLQEEGCDSLAELYVNLLRELETTRPNVFGNRAEFAHVRAYRENVVRLSIAVLNGAITGAEFEKSISSQSNDGQLGLVYRIVMLCQVLDDGFDYAHDLMNGLPTFLTGHALLEHSLRSTAQTVHEYGRVGPTNSRLSPFRITLRILYWTTLSGLNAAHARMRLADFGQRLFLVK